MERSPDATVDSDEVLARIKKVVDEQLGGLVVGLNPPRLYDAARYVLAGGGKRLRPALVVLSAEIFDVGIERALPAALSVETFHNFTLVHDDIMDDADERRGRPTVHRKWDMNTAILVGDYLLSLSYRLLSESEEGRLREMLQTYHAMVAHLCEGQMLDADFETRTSVDVSGYFEMVDRKTGALLAACMEMGGILGGAEADARGVLAEAGLYLGRAFQVRDDLLDVTADDDRWGKTIGGDLVQGKRTYLLLRALEILDGDERDWFQKIITNGGLPKDKIEEARRRMTAAGVTRDAAERVREFTEHARGLLTALPQGRSRGVLDAVFARMQTRLH